MKKLMMILLASSLVFLLGACGDQAIDDKSLEDIFSESIAAMEELESYSMEMEMVQELSAPSEESMTIKMTTVSQVQQNPLLMFQKMTADMGIEEVAYESYFSEEDGFFMEDPMIGEWMKLPDELVSEMMDIEKQMSPEDQLKPLQEFISDLSLTADDDSYMISIKGEDVDIEAIFEQISDLYEEELLGIDGLMPEMRIDKLDYEIMIDKETMYQTEANISISLFMEFMGEEMTTNQNIHLKLANFNELDTIDIPEEILKNAVEMSEDELFGL